MPSRNQKSVLALPCKDSQFPAYKTRDSSFSKYSEAQERHTRTHLCLTPLAFVGRALRISANIVWSTFLP